MKYTFLFILTHLFYTVNAQTGIPVKNSYLIGKGQMPNVAKDKQNNLHLVFGSGDSMLYANSSNAGKTFSTPALIATLPHVFTYAGRGPQVAVTNGTLVVIAPTSTGDIYSFYKSINEGSWTMGTKVNDSALTAKEGLASLSADGDNAFAVWLDTRGNGYNKIYGAKSTDGGKTWSKNILVYASPDTTVCECCKPSVVVKGSKVYVMFRNWLHGSRDLYLAQSADGGNHFEVAKKLGTGTWPLNGCPMDGGGLAVDENGTIQTVWRRDNKIYANNPGMPEKEIGEGKGCTLESINGNNVYAWTNNGDIILVKHAGQKEVLAKGKQPVIKAADAQHIICVWENEKQIHAAIIPL